VPGRSSYAARPPGRPGPRSDQWRCLEQRPRSYEPPR